MSEEAVATEAVAPETSSPEASGIAEAVETLSNDTPSSDESLGFLDSIGEQLEGVGEDTSVQESTESEATPQETETSEVVEESSDVDTDLASEFPTADTLSDVLDEKASAKWGELRSELSQARARAAELEGQLGDAPEQSLAASALEEKLHSANEMINAMEHQLSISRVETSPEYQRVVTEPLQNIMDATEALAQRNEQDPGVLMDILSESNIQRQNQNLEQVTENMGDRDKMMLYRMVDDAQAIFAHDRELKEHAAEAAAELDYQNNVYEQEALKEYEVSSRASINKVYDKFESVLPELEGADMGELRQKTLADNFLDLEVDHQAYAVSA
jgi:myosin heavy subunit